MKILVVISKHCLLNERFGQVLFDFVTLYLREFVRTASVY